MSYEYIKTLKSTKQKVAIIGAFGAHKGHKNCMDRVRWEK